MEQQEQCKSEIDQVLSLNGFLALTASVRLPSGSEGPFFSGSTKRNHKEILQHIFGSGNIWQILDPEEMDIRLRPPESSVQSQPDTNIRPDPKRPLTYLGKHFEFCNNPALCLSNKSDPEEAMNRLNASWDGKRYSYNDYVVVPNGSITGDSRLGNGDRQGEEVGFDLMLLFAYRRSMLFDRSFGLRLYNVFLPTGRFLSGLDGRQFIVAPLICLYATNDRRALRRLLTISIIFLPVNDAGHARTMNVDEIAGVTKGQLGIIDWLHQSSFTLSGQLLDFLGGERKLFSPQEILEATALRTVELTLRREVTEGGEGLPVLVSCRNSRVASALLLDPALSETACRGELIAQLAEYAKRVILGQAYESRKCDIADLEKLEIGGLLGSGASLSFYNPQERRLAAFLPQGKERFPGSSLKWMLPWDVTACTGLASVMEMVASFYHEVEKQPDLASLADVTREFVEDFEEFYDLGLLVYGYKAQYQKMKALGGLELSHSRLMRKMEALNAAMTIKAQTSSALHLLWLTVVVTVATVLGLLKLLTQGPPVGHAIVFMSILTIVLGVVWGCYGTAKIRSGR